LSIAGYIKPWNGYAFRHIPDMGSADVRDFKYCALARTNRWNIQGEPTLYLAKEKSVAIGEFARHFSENRSLLLSQKTHKRQIWRFSVKLTQTVNLCDLNACSALSLTDPPHCFENMQVARSTATFLRNSLNVEAIFVPSMVFIDDLSKWCLVIFLENLPNDSMQFLPEGHRSGYLKIQ
jgi:RES domain-containing protein